MADELSKLDHQLEGALRKIERQYADIEPNPSLQIAINNRGVVEYQSPSSYLADFHWDISKYPPSKSLPELMTIIEDRQHNLDDDIKAQTSKFVEHRNALSQATKKETGGLLNKDLNDVLTADVCSGGIREQTKSTLIAMQKRIQRALHRTDTSQSYEDLHRIYLKILFATSVFCD